ncbi:NADH-quinone oxidoreductase subunit M [Novosphingobium capsulatum]|uniref:NADH-quinone oxidoreductase subunit M n=1 Tax=Novosphingobium capsulatum TaxID=13688 RepID=A0ABU1MGG0_9SPHN|nr:MULTISPECIES: NADH-quinone oxidoreductase subunit M [Novosphingobium]MBB3358540.1 NADH-quinone oxidoreductase subunit M [Novosphingobium sp. BK256]MBB3374901.1 NADH-quinone oxidoreductase subunit M [Novosphingobium sp. BK280]MBB3379410.1 NADH-quinone oxidoreductase subunit M [Novosphingobium sp. BK258]MBB3421105.1 NADH-quinone oxidoreductase subunit M [Novosphingobium sp. BK267]MBB3449322.1 NADH-quinone oxidoreductase subunit M [Novosphingobium sp. BK352]
MTGFPILSLMLLVPLVGAGLVLKANREQARLIALIATLIDFVLGVVLWMHFDVGGAQWQFQERAALFSGFEWKLGIDGIALLLIALTVFLMPICIGASWNSIEKRAGEYYAAFLLMETLMIGVFTAQDLFLFYIMFEAGLIPMYLIIGIWGGADRIYASYKFFLYTLLGSVLMLIAMFWMVNVAGTSDIPTLMAYNFPVHAQTWLWLAFFASFAVKMPMWPVHTWLPDAHVQAPTAGSVILAGVLLKMGGYGFIRFSLPMFPEASAQFAPLVWGLSMAAVVITSLIALVQQDIKKLIAYSSVAHMAIVTIGLFAFNTQGLEGSMLIMLSHGLVAGALFLGVGVIYDRLHTREITRYGGLAINMPYYALFMLLFTMASIGLPGTSGFVGEFLSLMGVYAESSWVALVCTTGIILGAAYMLYLYRRVIFGDQKNADAAAMLDLDKREWAMMVPLAAVVLWMGVYPESFLAPMRKDIAALEARVAPAKPKGDAQLKLGVAQPVGAAAHEEAAHGEAH